jgi:DNA-binding MurR/RpiR family transcriptional regulator
VLFTYEKIKRFNDLEFEVYNQIIELDKKVLDLKIRQLAELCHVSTTVILNFCKKLDCDGWTVFKMKYKECLEENQPNHSTKRTPIQDFLHLYETDTDKQNQMNYAIELIEKAARVTFIGAGPSGVLAKYGSSYLANIGKSTHYIDTPYYPIPKEDYSQTVVLALSVSGETLSVIQRLTRFKELGATVISIVNTSENTIAKMSDLCLSYYVEQEEFYISEKTSEFHVNMTTQIPVMYIIEEIVHQLMAKTANVITQ